MTITVYPPIPTPYSILVSSGELSNTEAVHKFGAVNSMSVNTTGTVWDVDDTLYPWASLASAQIIYCISTSASDTGSLVVSGLDTNYAPLTETVTLTGTSAVATTNAFIRVFRMYYTSGANVGDITARVTSGAGTIVAKIYAGNAQTLMAIYTIPAGKTGYLYQGAMSAQAGADATGNMFVRYFGESAFRIGHSFEISGNGGEYFYPFAFPVKIPEKSDIDVRAKVRSNNGRYTAAFDLLLVDN